MVNDMPDEIIVDSSNDSKVSKIRFIYRGNKVYLEEDGVEKLLKVDDEYVGEYRQPTSRRKKKITRKQLDKLVDMVRSS